jgi:DSF synthase
MRSNPRPSFSTGMVTEINRFQESLKLCFQPSTVRYLVVGSMTPGIFSVGGDLSLFRELIERRDVAALTEYAEACVTILDNHYRSMDLPVISIALVQGDAIGAGFETALAADVRIAERSAKFGFPEIIFNLVPGHGAYNFLTRHIGPHAARDIILGGKLYSADEMKDMGLIDILVEDGEGRQALNEFVRRRAKTWNARLALQRIERTTHRVSREELEQSGKIWVESAMQLDTHHLKIMDRLIRAQDRAVSQTSVPARALETCATVI